MSIPVHPRILIIEDSEDDALLAIEQLSVKGHAPVWELVSSAEEMRQALARGTWDVVISDHAMPNFSALDALRVLHEGGIDIPFIIVSGAIGEEVAVAAMKAGAHDYVMKDNLSRLAAVIEREMKEAQVRQERRQGELALQESNLRLSEALDTLQRVQQQMIQQERLDALQQLVGGVVHDIHNLMIPVAGFAELLLTRPERLGNEEQAKQDLKRILTATEDVVNLTRRLRQFYRPFEESEPLRPVDINRLVTECVQFTAPRWRQEAQAKDIRIAVETDLTPVPLILGVEGELREVLTNLIFNAVDALPAGGSITLSTQEAKGRVKLEVKDSGTGMPEPVVKRCLEPFFTTKGSKGTGMGLALVYGIVQGHHGSVSIDSAPGRGTTISLSFPPAENLS